MVLKCKNPLLGVVAISARCEAHSTLVPYWKSIASFPTSNWPQSFSQAHPLLSPRNPHMWHSFTNGRQHQHKGGLLCPKHSSVDVVFLIDIRVFLPLNMLLTSIISVSLVFLTRLWVPAIDIFCQPICDALVRLVHSALYCVIMGGLSIQSASPIHCSLSSISSMTLSNRVEGGDC